MKEKICPWCNKEILNGQVVRWRDDIPEPDRPTISKPKAPLYHEACFVSADAAGEVKTEEGT